MALSESSPGGAHPLRVTAKNATSDSASAVFDVWGRGACSLYPAVSGCALVNIGTNRWSFKPEVGISKAIGPRTLEFEAAVTLYTDNDDFFGGHTLSQDPLYSMQGHLIYVSHSGIWARSMPRISSAAEQSSTTC